MASSPTSAPFTNWQQLLLADMRQDMTFTANFSGSDIDDEQFTAAVATAMRCCAALSSRVALQPTGHNKIAYDATIIENAVGNLRISDYPNKNENCKQLFAVSIVRTATSSLLLHLTASPLIWDIASYHNFMLCLDEAYAGKPLYPEALTFIDHALAEEAQRNTAEHLSHQLLCRRTLTPFATKCHDSKVCVKEIMLNVSAEQMQHCCHTTRVSAERLTAAIFAMCVAQAEKTADVAFTMLHDQRLDNPAAAYTTGSLMPEQPVVAHCTPTSSWQCVATSLSTLSACAYADFVCSTATRLSHTVAYLGNMLCHPAACCASVTESISFSIAPNADFGLFVYQNSPGCHTLRAEYHSASFSEQQVSTFLQHYAHLLTQAVTTIP